MSGATSKRPGWLRSAFWAAGIAIPLCLWGSYASMALAHGGGPLALLFAPVFPVLLLFGTGGPFEGTPDWVFDTLAVSAEFAGILLVVHAIRVVRAKRFNAAQSGS